MRILTLSTTEIIQRCRHAVRVYVHADKPSAQLKAGNPRCSPATERVKDEVPLRSRARDPECAVEMKMERETGLEPATFSLGS